MFIHDSTSDAPVVKMTTLQFVLGVVAYENFKLRQLDVKTTFIHGDVDEENYMEWPKGFASPGQEHLVCRCRGNPCVFVK